jgi:nucleotide-binding universal stress UspA family protein
VNADLIVLGTQGRTGLSRLLAGSVAETVLRQAPCPVLALHAAPRTGGAEAIQVILHPTDFSEQSAAALAVARELARMHGARLILLHVAPILGAIALEAPVTLGDPEAYRQALDDLRQRTDGPDLKYPVEIQLEQGEAAPLTIRAAEKLGCSLIVLGTHGRTGLGRVLMGSVAEAILRGAPCPVLALKGRQAERAEAAPAAAQPASKSVLII